MAALQRMKIVATALLVLSAAVYALAPWEWLERTAEAAMVGGLADWFAVTALFRRMPLPHTGIVPRQKDAIAGRLGEFVRSEFVTRDVVVAQLHEAQVLQRAASYVARPDVADRVARELAFNAVAVLDAVDEDAVVASVLELLRRDQARRSYAPVLGRVLDRALDGGTQRPLVDVLVAQGRSYLRSHREELLPQARSFVDDRGWLASLLVSDKRLRNVIDGVADLLDEVARTPDHRVRRWLEELLRGVARDLQHDRHTAAQLDALVLQLLDDPQAQAVLHDVVTDALASVRDSLRDSDGVLHDRVVGLVTGLAERVRDDEAFRGRLERVAESVVGHAVDNYGDQLVSLIRNQVAQWDPAGASRRIELAVGRDLQFIRINGTVVGGLAGLAIWALSQL